jgi:predicted HicB family RNase H-like nuclease
MNTSDLIEYKQYHGSVHFDAEQEIFYGKVEFIRDLINFEASDAKSLVQSFKDAVDEYLEDCKILNKTPDIPFKGSFNIRISPSLHRDIGLYAMQHDSSVNSIVKSALKDFIAQRVN